LFAKQSNQHHWRPAEELRSRYLLVFLVSLKGHPSLIAHPTAVMITTLSFSSM
jgi:hypothetical protein